MFSLPMPPEGARLDEKLCLCFAGDLLFARSKSMSFPKLRALGIALGLFVAVYGPAFVAVSLIRPPAQGVVPLIMAISLAIALVLIFTLGRRTAGVLGDFRGPDRSLSSSAAVGTHYLPDLGNPDRSRSVAMPFDGAGKLAGEPGWRRAVPGRLLAALSGRVGLSAYASRPAYGCRRSCLYFESRPLRPCLPWGTPQTAVARRRPSQ